MPTPEQVNNIRQSIAANSRKLRKIIDADSFVHYFGKVSGDSLKKAPQGYPKDHPELELLKLKQHMAVNRLTDVQVAAPDITLHVIEVFKALKPYVSHMYEIAVVPIAG